MATLKFDNKEVSKLFANIYIVANDAYFLYSKFRAEPYIEEIARQYSAKEIQDVFLKLGKEGISNFDELANAYALYISLTFKPIEEVEPFFNGEGNVNFEWFSDIKDIYLSNYVPLNNFSIDLTACAPKPNITFKEAIPSKTNDPNQYTINLPHNG